MAGETAASVITAAQDWMQVIAGDMANSLVNGAKARRPDFAIIATKQIRANGENTTDAGTKAHGVQIPSYVYLQSTQIDMSQGDLDQTGNPMDIAIQGDGHLRVMHPDGDRFMRTGSLRQGDTLQTPDGFTISPGITVPPDALDLAISESGVVSGRVPGQNEPVEFGQLEVVTFKNAAGLRQGKNNLFFANDVSGPAIGGIAGLNNVGTIQQGFIEKSNIKMVNNLIAMMEAHKTSSYATKVLEREDKMQQQTASAA
jgi:flagellar basal-body rod protein FlgG